MAVERWGRLDVLVNNAGISILRPVAELSAPPADADPCRAAFADIRARGTHGAHPAWTVRTAHEWEYYFAAQAHEATGLLRGTPADTETYLHVRRGSPPPTCPCPCPCACPRPSANAPPTSPSPRRPFPHPGCASCARPPSTSP
ncbi:terpene synthase family protein [Streptomyces sp. NPDC060000]|uniref:terpene synthase family protein n=1 Tax=Streptomyces sp. NPDC060000 TaxID=3347031 RepID=UPI003680695E